MQLFVTEYKKKDTHITITDLDLLSQLRKVLRANIGDSICIQGAENEVKKTRYEVKIQSWDDKNVEGIILSEQIHIHSDTKKSMIVAMPNKWDKIELIVQKLTECGLDHIVFWPSERSIIREWNPKKEQRLHKIIKEATEQSRGRMMPELNFAHDISTYLQNTEVIIFDTPETKNEKQEIQNISHLTGIVWPEGGLTQKDYEVLAWTNYTVYGLGETVLRTETAAIIWWWIIKNSEKLILQSPKKIE